MFSNLFPNAAAVSPSSVQNQDSASIDKAISSLKDAQDKLDERKERFEKKIRDLTASAKQKSKEGNKKRALHYLKQRKTYEKQLLLIPDKKLNLERTICALENSESNNIVYQAIKGATKALKESNTNTVEQVDDVMEDFFEIMDEQREINEILGGNVGMDDLSDDALKEIEKLEDEIANENKDEIVNEYKFPEVPNTKWVSKESCDSGAAREAPSLNTLLTVKENDIAIKPVSNIRKSSDINLEAGRVPPCLEIFSRSEKKNEDISARSRKRKFRSEFLPGEKSTGGPPPAKKKRVLGFNFPRGPRFPTVPRIGETKPKHPSKKVKSKCIVKDAAVREAIDNEEATNLAILERLYD